MGPESPTHSTPHPASSLTFYFIPLSTLSSFLIADCARLKFLSLNVKGLRNPVTCVTIMDIASNEYTTHCSVARLTLSVMMFSYLKFLILIDFFG